MYENVKTTKDDGKQLWWFRDGTKLLGYIEYEPERAEKPWEAARMTDGVGGGPSLHTKLCTHPLDAIKAILI